MHFFKRPTNESLERVDEKPNSVSAKTQCQSVNWYGHKITILDISNQGNSNANFNNKQLLRIRIMDKVKS